MLDKSLEQEKRWDASMNQLLKCNEIAKANGSRFAVVIFPFL